jgi:hypothetical protein
MLKYNSEFITIYKLGFLVADVPEDVMDAIRVETEEMEINNFDKSIPHNYSLVGNIEREYTIIKSASKIEEYVTQLAPEYFANYNGSEGIQFKVPSDNNISTGKQIWVNFQKKYEFNPPHKHSGDLSFVIYVKVPYLYEEECNNPSIQNSNTKVAGLFSFMHADQYNHGGIASFPIVTDKKFEGKIIMFSSSFYHTVYPFYTSDEYRISVAGNLIAVKND